MSLASDSNLPLVSIIVITYNSSPYIIETLESIKKQSYQKIELIISDDFSKDNTVELVSSWLSHKEHVSALVSYKFVKNSINLGISGNCTSGLKECTGDWIKLIAGDDILLPDCVSEFVKFSNKNSDAKLLVSSLTYFNNDINFSLRKWPLFRFPTNLQSQLKLQLKGGFIKAPAVFMNRQLLLDVGGFDTKYPFFEDDPLWLKFLSNGNLFHFVPHCLVGYRQHDQAISNGKSLGYINPLFFSSYKKFKEEEIFPLMLKKNMYFSYFLSLVDLKLQNNIFETGNLRSSVKLYHRLGFFIITKLKTFLG